MPGLSLSWIPVAAALMLPAAAGDMFAARRAAMVAKIAETARRAAPAADTPAFRRTIDVIGRMPRELFVTKPGRELAYVDVPQSIGYGQTISDPYIVTIMTAALDLPTGATVLDVGTGSGYQAAVLSPLADQVWSIEIVAPLARSAARRLDRMGYRNVHVRSGDGFAGWPEHAPFDGIVVAAGASEVPQPLLDQLKVGGRMVIPIGPSTAQEQLLRVTKGSDGAVTRCSLGLAMFVPLTGRGERPPATRGLIDQTIPYCFGAPIT